MKIKYAKAAILLNQNKPLIVDKIKLPESLKFGQVFVKVHQSGICGSQIGEIKGVKGEDKFLPHLLGHEGCATVIEVGEGVKTVKKDDLVVLHWRKGSGINSDVPIYEWEGKKINAGWVTTFNDYAVVSENRCTKVAKDTNKDLATLFGCAITTGFGVIENNANIQLGQSLVVFGAGGIGLNIIQAASLRSAYPIIALDLFDERLKFAKEMGATHLINTSRSNAKKEILNIIKDNYLDIFIDNTGIPEIIEIGYELISPIGKLILVGVPKFKEKIKINTLPMHFGKLIIGSHGGNSDPEKDIPRYINLFKYKKIDVSKLITKRVKLNEINYAIKLMTEGITAGRVIVEL